MAARRNGATATAEAEKRIELHPLTRHGVIVPIIGLTPVMPHRWSEKAIAMMRDKQFGQAVRPKREPKNPEEEAEAATYRLEDGRAGLPATAFKAAMVEGCRFFEGVTMVMSKMVLQVHGEGAEQLVALDGPAHMDESLPRNDNGNPDLRYRNRFWPWKAELRISYLASVFDGPSIINLVDAAGMCGVGDWRPSSPKSKTGTLGTFAVDRSSKRKVTFHDDVAAVVL